MAEWFVDAGISGGNGTDPASAFPSVTSIVWVPGDRAWVRKTHVEALQSSLFLGPQTPAANGHARWNQIIGWPSSGDPFFDDRPARGTTVGWDGDNATGTCKTTFGLNFPTFTTSNATGNANCILLGNGVGIYNVSLQNSGSLSATIMPWAPTGNPFTRWLDNVCFLAQGGYVSGMDRFARFMAGKVIFPLSAGTGQTAAFNQFMNIQHLLIHSLGMTGSGLFAGASGSACYIGLLEILTNSISYFMGFNGGDTAGQETGAVPTYIHTYVGRVLGQRPFTDISSKGAASAYALRCDDYFGEGPRVIASGHNPMTRVASTQEAQHNSLPCVHFNVESIAAANQIYNDNRWRGPVIRKYFNVVSGTQITINLPIFCDSTATFSPSGGGLRMTLLTRGGYTKTCGSAHLIAGSYTNWTGSLVAVANGSVWLFQAAWTPIETNSAVPLEVHLTPWFQATSGTGLTAYGLLGEPYAS